MWPDGPQRIEVGDCDCSIAWLYKDAHKYGLTQYQDLVGDSGNNIICDSAGAILLAEDPEFIGLMDSCPGYLNMHISISRYFRNTIFSYKKSIISCKIKRSFVS